MKEPNKNNTRFKGKYKDVFLVFAALMITGVLLAVSAYAQLDPQPPGASGLGDFTTSDNMGVASSNQPPTLTALESDKSSPQEAGSSIKWTARATDPENDPMSFIFRLKGPSTGNVWKPVNQDLSDNTWKWDTNSIDAGDYQISVTVRDEMHAGPQFTPDEKISDVFTLTAVEPLPVVTAQEQTYVPPVQEQPANTQTLAPSQEVIPANLAPVMTSLTPVPASPQEAGIVVTWEAIASDPESDGLQYQFLLDGSPITGWQDLNQWTWETSVNEIGDHSIEAIVRDGSHNMEGDSSKNAKFTINKPNEKPSISDLSADKASPQETGSIVTWTAKASDPESDPILYRFFLNQLPTTDWQSSDKWSWTAAEGEAQIEVQVRDGKHAEQDGFDDSKSATFVILPPNQKPAIINFSPDKQSPQETGSTITWTVESMDAENDPLQFLFSLDGQVMQDWSDSSVWSWTATKEQVGGHVIEARVRDGKHNPDGDSSKAIDFAISAPPNNPPVVTDLASDLVSAQLSGTIVTWTAQASDPESDPISYRFLVNGTPATEWQPENTWTWTAIEPGISQISVQVKDSLHEGAEGEAGNMSREFSIIAPAPEIKPVQEPVQTEVVPAEVVPAKLNESPVLSSLTAESVSPQLLGTAVAWTAQASDPESDPISYRFLVNGTPATDWQLENLWTWTATEPGTSQISVQVKDNLHEGAEGEAGNMSREFSINAPAPEIKPVQEPVQTEVVPAEVVPAKLNESPVLSSLAADSISPQLLGTAVAWTAQASDPESDPISYRFLVNGTPATEWQPENTWTWTAMLPGTSQISVQVKDSLHEGAEGEAGNLSREFTINAPLPVEGPVTGENVPPVTENITTPTAPENVTIAPETVVPPLDENITTPTAPENVTPQQPVNETKIVEPVIPAAVNQTPVLNSLTSDVTSPQIPGTTITWTANATDADRDPLLFRFFHSGPATSGAWQPVTEWNPAGTWTQTTSSSDAGENQVKAQVRDGKHAASDSFDSELSAFMTLRPPARNISGAAYDDKNGNSLLDSGEALSGWTIRLAGPDGEVSALTREDGTYRFELLLAGSYTVRETLPTGWKALTPESGSYSVDLMDKDVSERNFVNKLSSYSISGMKYNDLNGNGVNDGEPGMEGWTIQLSKEGSVVNSTTTGKDGSYKFADLMPGSYSIKEVEQSGWARTAPLLGSYSVVLVDADVTGKDFGNHGSWSISGANFNDLNGNGAKDGDETALAGWNIQLAKDGNTINATTTGQDGSYAFKNLAPGKYTVSEVAQEGWTQTLPEGPYSVDLLDADVSGKDFGNKGNLSITGKKFYDANGNGVQDEDELGLPGQEVKLVENGKEIARVTTGQDGTYTFSNLVPGTYEVDDPILVTVTTQIHVVVNVPAFSPNIIFGMKFNDLNGNGIKDTGELGVPNWGIDLVYVVPGPAPDILLAQVNTDANGAYKFINIPPGNYEIKELARQGWTATTPTVRAVHIPGISSNQDFGNKLATPPSLGSIFGMKFNDLNGNGVKDGGDAGLSGWTIQLKNATSLTVISTTNTGPDGTYAFLNITPANYIVSEVAKSGWTQTKPPAPGAQVYSFALAAGENKQGIDFGNRNNNLPPTNPTLVSNLAGPRMVGTPVIWTAGATDPEGDTQQFRFFVRGPAPSPAVRADTGYSTNNVWTWSTVGYAPGAYQIEVWIRDGNHAGLAGFDIKKTVSFTLTSANLPPRVNMLFSDRPAPQFMGSWIKWTAVASDPEGAPLQYKFYLRGPSTNGFWMDQTGWGNNNRWIWRTNPMDVGYSEVLVAVRDGSHAGPGGSDDYEIADFSIINQNLPPVITGLASNVFSPQPIGATVMWRASAMDPEGNPVFYRYWLKGPATGGSWRIARDWSTDPTFVWPTSPADAGTSEIQVQVRDGLHSSPSGWDDDAGALFTVQRQNQPPALLSLKPDKPSSQAAGTPIKWMAVASDPDREPVFYKFWLKGQSTGNAWKTVQDWSTKNLWTWASSGSDRGAYTVYVYARDGKHNPATGYDSALGASYLLTPNQPPKLTALLPDKLGPLSAGNAVKWTAKASDANKEPILYRFWLKGPSTGNAWKVVADWSINNQWTWTNSGSDSGEYTVFVYVRDGMHSPATGYDSALGASYLLTPNQPPKLAALLPDKKNPQSAGTIVKWTATATDVNKDPILYRFWLNGPSTGNVWKAVSDWSTKNQWTWTNAPTDGGNYRIFVYARDGKHAPATGYDSALGQDYALLNQVVSNKVVSKVVVVKR